ncbi:MAG: carboxypeptidase regulatory-like domain-containing protein, partial [Calditrichaeota bacterium]|nr:carboxypeptidase regulatory-like domain-containing protein [Calditrichota bacterium]
MKRPILFAVFLLLGATTMLFSGTTGKIAGIVKDARTGEALPGVNILVDGTVLGAATDADGYYVILNVPPGTYTVRATFIGYTDYIVTQARVNIDQTTTLNFDMAQAVVESGSEITVVADRPVVQRDVSASTANIEAAQIEALPVQTVTEVVGLQAGVQGLSIRGGGSDELAFMVDGFTMRDERDNTPFTGVSLSAVQDVQIQTGGFNAEYGNIRSGVINVVTKEGDPQRYSGTLTYQYSAPTDKHFGPSFDDPNSYWLRPYLDPAVAWTGTQNGAWDADMQRQYPQFDGWNAIAAQTLLDNDPNNDLTPAAAQRLFLWQHRRQLDITKSDYNIDAGVGGPVPG